MSVRSLQCQMQDQKKYFGRESVIINHSIQKLDITFLYKKTFCPQNASGRLILRTMLQKDEGKKLFCNSTLPKYLRYHSTYTSYIYNQTWKYHLYISKTLHQISYSHYNNYINQGKHECIDESATSQLASYHI